MSDPSRGGDRAGAGPGGPGGPGASGGSGGPGAPGGSGLGGDTAGGGIPRGIAAAIAEVSDRATLLVREEIELAKAEVAEKATRLVKGAVVGLAAGIFIVTALFFVLIGCAWLLYFYLPIGNDFTYFWGFFAMALILLVLGLLAGLIAARVVKRGAPPTPDMAFEEARRIRDTVSSTASNTPDASSGATTHGASTGDASTGSASTGSASTGSVVAAGASASSSVSAAAESVPAPYGAATPHAGDPSTGAGGKGQS